MKMFYNEVNKNLSFLPIDNPINDKMIRIMALEGITGLKGLQRAFENNDGLTEVESILDHLNRTYNLSDGDYDILNYLVGVVKFSEISLQNINVNYEDFYYNMTTYEAIEIVLTKLIDHSGNIGNKNGFPEEFNFTLRMTNLSQTRSDGKKWFPYVPKLFVPPKQNLNFDENSKARLDTYINFLKSRFLDGFSTNDSIVLFHGTSWEGALSIMEGIRILPRMRATDFGLRNFYLGDSLRAAFNWANRNDQPAISIFIIPNLYIESLNEHLKFTYDEDWLNFLPKQKINFPWENWNKFIFGIRNYPKPGKDYNRRLLKYDDLITYADTRDLISGPIMGKMSNTNYQEIEAIQYGDIIPYQYSFKDTTINSLNNMLAVTVFIQRNN